MKSENPPAEYGELVDKLTKLRMAKTVEEVEMDEEQRRRMLAAISKPSSLPSRTPFLCLTYAFH